MPADLTTRQRADWRRRAQVTGARRSVPALAAAHVALASANWWATLRAAWDIGETFAVVLLTRELAKRMPLVGLSEYRREQSLFAYRQELSLFLVDKFRGMPFHVADTAYRSALRAAFEELVRRDCRDAFLIHPSALYMSSATLTEMAAAGRLGMVAALLEKRSDDHHAASHLLNAAVRTGDVGIVEALWPAMSRHLLYLPLNIDYSADDGATVTILEYLHGRAAHMTWYVNGDAWGESVSRWLLARGRITRAQMVGSALMGGHPSLPVPGEEDFGGQSQPDVKLFEAAAESGHTRVARWAVANAQAVELDMWFSHRVQMDPLSANLACLRILCRRWPRYVPAYSFEGGGVARWALVRAVWGA